MPSPTIRNTYKHITLVGSNDRTPSISTEIEAIGRIRSDLIEIEKNAKSSSELKKDVKKYIRESLLKYHPDKNVNKQQTKYELAIFNVLRSAKNIDAIYNHIKDNFRSPKSRSPSPKRRSKSKSPSPKKRKSRSPSPKKRKSRSPKSPSPSRKRRRSPGQYPNISGFKENTKQQKFTFKYKRPSPKKHSPSPMNVEPYFEGEPMEFV